MRPSHPDRGISETIYRHYKPERTTSKSSLEWWTMGFTLGMQVSTTVNEDKKLQISKVKSRES